MSSLRITVLCLSLLFILTFWGTIAQVDHGLYRAQQRFFNSFIFFIWGILPFPGAQGVLWLLFLNLVCVTLTRFAFLWRNIGILMIHLGLLSYFIAAFVTLRCAEESNVTLYETEGTNVSSAYHDWELSIWQDGSGNRHVLGLALKGLHDGDMIQTDAFPLQIKMLSYFGNTTAYTASLNKRSTPVINDSGIKDIAPADLEKEPEKNFPGAIVQLRDDRGGDLQDVLLYGGEVQPTKLLINGKNYFVQLRRKRFPLPFSIILKDFRMEKHPNTEIAKSYQSLVEIRNDNVKRDVLISMNEPLRFKDYTFYQASYAIDALGRELSTLAVVKNQGRLMPYFASLITFLGLMTHFMQMAFKKDTAKMEPKKT